jgi:hypothetical protein
MFMLAVEGLQARLAAIATLFLMSPTLSYTPGEVLAALVAGFLRTTRVEVVVADNLVHCLMPPASLEGMAVSAPGGGLEMVALQGTSELEVREAHTQVGV